MGLIVTSLFAKPLMTLGVGAFLSGVALMYLVMQRTRKHRMQKYADRQP